MHVLVSCHSLQSVALVSSTVPHRSYVSIGPLESFRSVRPTLRRPAVYSDDTTNFPGFCRLLHSSPWRLATSHTAALPKADESHHLALYFLCSPAFFKTVSCTSLLASMPRSARFLIERRSETPYHGRNQLQLFSSSQPLRTRRRVVSCTNCSDQHCSQHVAKLHQR